MNFSIACRASKYSCVWILDTVRHFYLYFIFISILTSKLNCTKSTSTLITDIHCINTTAPGVLIRSQIVWSAPGTRNQFFYFLAQKKIWVDINYFVIAGMCIYSLFIYRSLHHTPVFNILDIVIPGYLIKERIPICVFLIHTSREYILLIRKDHFPALCQKSKKILYWSSIYTFQYHILTFLYKI